MLDKSIRYIGLYMRRPAGAPVAEHPLPDGYRFVFFKKGDEADWSRIETSVLEFDSEFSALMYFKDRFMPHISELERRCLFIENPQGVKIATATAWWHMVGDERRPWLHWVSVDPRCQGLGLGRALTAKVTNLMIQLDGDTDFFLHTQTWSHRAINIYIANGYQPTDEKILYKTRDCNCKKAIKLLKKKNLLRI